MIYILKGTRSSSVNFSHERQSLKYLRTCISGTKIAEPGSFRSYYGALRQSLLCKVSNVIASSNILLLSLSQVTRKPGTEASKQVQEVKVNAMRLTR